MPLLVPPHLRLVLVLVLVPVLPPLPPPPHTLPAPNTSIFPSARRGQQGLRVRQVQAHPC
jgi:hypothetical protein